MSGYRPIYKRIWKDPDFQELSAEDKLLFIYLCTNEMTSESGIYPVTAKTIIYETGLDDKTVVQRLSNGCPTVDKQLGNGCFKNVVYDKENKLIFIKKLRKYNTGGRPELISKSIINEYQLYPHTFLWGIFLQEYPEFQPLFNGCPTVLYDNDNHIDNHIDTVLKGDCQGVNIFKIYESNIGMLTPMLSENLKDLEKQYPIDWIKDAIEVSVKSEKRNLRYVEGILKSWKQGGKDNGFGTNQAGHNQKQGSDNNRKLRKPEEYTDPETLFEHK